MMWWAMPTTVSLTALFFEAVREAAENGETKRKVCARASGSRG